MHPIEMGPEMSNVTVIMAVDVRDAGESLFHFCRSPKFIFFLASTKLVAA